jgi:hypothetical protein
MDSAAFIPSCGCASGKWLIFVYDGIKGDKSKLQLPVGGRRMQQLFLGSFHVITRLLEKVIKNFAY